MTLFLTYGAPDPETGKNPNWRTFGYPGPSRRPRTCRRRSRSASRSPAARRRSRPTLHRRLRGGRLGRRRDPRGPRAQRHRPRGRRLLQRIRLHPAGASRLPADVLARRPDADGRGQRDAPGGDDSRRRHHDQLDQLPAHQAVGPRAVGAASSGSTASTAPSSTPPRRGVGAARRQLGLGDLNGPQLRMQEGARRSAGASRRSPATPTRRRTRRDRRPTRLRRPVRLQAEGRQDLARRRAEPRASCSPMRGRASLEDGRAAGVEADGSRRTAAARRVTVHAPRVVVAAGSLESPALLLRSEIGGPAVGRPPAAPSLHRGPRRLRRRPAGVVGRAAGRALRRVRRHRRRLRLPDRGRAVRARPDRLGDAVESAADHKERMAELPLRRAFIWAHPRPRPRLRRGRRERRGGAVYSVNDELDVENLRKGSTFRPGCTRPPAPTHLGAGRRAPTWRRGDDLEEFMAGARRIPSGRAAQALQRPPDGHVPDGPRPGSSVADPRGELHDTKGVWIGDAQRVPDLLRHQPDDHDHGPGPPHRRRDRRRCRRSRGRRRQRGAASDNQEVPVGN